jgi:hypothetical protein
MPLRGWKRNAMVNWLTMLALLLMVSLGPMKYDQWEKPIVTPGGWHASAWADCANDRIVFSPDYRFEDVWLTLEYLAEGEWWRPYFRRVVHVTMSLFVHELAHCYEERYGTEGFDYSSVPWERMRYMSQDYCELPQERFACVAGEFPQLVVQWMVEGVVNDAR